MSALAIGFMNSSSGLSWLELQGAGMLPGMLGSDWQLQSGGAARQAETAAIALRGSLLELRAITDRLEALRSAAARRSDFCLRVWSDSRQCYLFSPIFTFDWQILPLHPRSSKGGSFRLELNWERERKGISTSTRPVAGTRICGNASRPYCDHPPEPAVSWRHLYPAMRVSQQWIDRSQSRPAQ